MLVFVEDDVGVFVLVRRSSQMPLTRYRPSMVDSEPVQENPHKFSVIDTGAQDNPPTLTSAVL